MKKGLIILLFVFLISNFSSAQQNNSSNSTNMSTELAQRTILDKCFPEYECGDWSKCDDFLQTRICKDKKCNVRDVREVRFCQTKDAFCQPNIVCENWGECNYEEYLGNTFEGKISFGGFRSRVCRDFNNCIPHFIEESICQDKYEFQLVIVKECGQEFLVANNLITKKQLAKINLDSLTNKRLDIITSQNQISYCSSCYNGVLDSNEEKIDCGGDCKQCKIEIKPLVPVKFIQIIFWFFAAIFFILLLQEIARPFYKEWKK